MCDLNVYGVCMHVCMCTHTCAYVCKHVCAFVCVCACTYMSVCVCLCVCIYLCPHLASLMGKYRREAIWSQDRNEVCLRNFVTGQTQRKSRMMRYLETTHKYKEEASGIELKESCWTWKEGIISLTQSGEFLNLGLFIYYFTLLVCVNACHRSMCLWRDHRH